ncbi:MAG TPA: hypothetical protein VF670_18790 [Duganella sp.]|jgi:hypothetical protein
MSYTKAAETLLFFMVQQYYHAAMGWEIVVAALSQQYFGMLRATNKYSIIGL